MPNAKRSFRSVILSAAAVSALASPAAASAATTQTTPGGSQETTSGRMLIGAGSQQLTLTSSRTMPDGRIKSQWSVGPGGSDGTASATAPAGSTISVTPNLMTISPPQALATANASNTGVAAAQAAWTNPAPGSDYNAVSGSHCFKNSCVYASSFQHAIQEQPGEWFIGQETSGTVYPASNSATLGEAYTRFPGESGDSGPLNYRPEGDHCASSGASWSWSFSYLGFGIGESSPLSANSCYGPIAPSSWGEPAFGSRWWSNGQGGNHGIGSADAIHLGAARTRTTSSR